MKKIAFTLDIDWAPEEVIQYALTIFSLYKVKCTLFCTHESEVIKNADKELFEIAIHPNFNDLLFEKKINVAEDTLDELLAIYPDAKGVRSHSLTQSSSLQLLFASKGLKYDSNNYLPTKDIISPYKCWTGMTRIPFHWEDDIHFLQGKSFTDEFDQNVKPNDCLVLNFHPIHVFLNTDKEETYKKEKLNYHNVKKLKEGINNDNVGTRDFLINQLERVKKNDCTHYNLNEFII
ncbi:MAG: hypothetical protein ABF272_04250 [Flavobacteriales bacterium]